MSERIAEREMETEKKERERLAWRVEWLEGQLQYALEHLQNYNPGLAEEILKQALED